MCGECNWPLEEIGNVKTTSFQENVDILVKGIVNSYKEYPNSENMTFEEIAEWSGKHVLLTVNEDGMG